MRGATLLFRLAIAAIIGSTASARAADDGVTTARQGVAQASINLAAIIQSCQEDVLGSIDAAAPQTPSDADEDVTSDVQLQDLGRKLAQKAEALRALAASAGLKDYSAKLEKPEKLDELRKRYRSYSRERELNRAESDLGYALRRRRIDEVAIDPAARKLVTSLKSFLSEFRRARAPTADLADQDPSREWKRRLADIDADAYDLRRETRILEIELSLLKLQEINMDSNWR